MIHVPHHRNQHVELSPKAKKGMGFIVLGFIAIITIVLIFSTPKTIPMVNVLA